MLIKKAAALEQAQTVDALWKGIVETLTTTGFDHVIYLSVSNAFENGFVLATVDSLYEDYQIKQDPFLIYACTSYEIMPIGAEFIDGHPYVDDQARDFVKRAAQGGILSALGIPMRLQGSGRFGGFIVGNAMDRATFMDRIVPRAEELRLFCLLMHRRLEELADLSDSPSAQADFREPLLAPALPSTFDDLSPREREVVYLLAQGRSRKEAATICGISVHTVSDYAKTGYRKLGVRNRAQAAAMIYSKKPVTP